MLQSKHYTRYKISGVFRKVEEQIRIKGATKQKPYLSALSEGKGQREGRILSKSTLPLLPSEPNGACLHSCSSCGKWLQERRWSLKSSCSWENKTSKGKSWLQCQHTGKKTKKQTQTKKFNPQLSSATVPRLSVPWLTMGPFASATESCSKIWVFLPCPSLHLL